ncbi:MAG: TRAM domain-containing protein, partial [Bacilli bacterium]|nr:TRAM domain-containing protein [Bacilli bacterium]
MRVTKLDNQGRGITYQDGKIIFVENALEDEEVSIIITQDKKKYACGIATNIKHENENRVIPKCPYYKKCGGCNLMHINYAYEEDYKLSKVKEILKKYAGIDADVRLIKNDRELFYRNKITLKIEDNRFGYYNASTHNFVEVNSCLLASPSI